MWKGKKMTFEQALKAMREGKKITRKGQSYYFYIQDGQAFFATNLCSGYECLFDYEDVTAEDWEIIDD